MKTKFKELTSKIFPTDVSDNMSKVDQKIRTYIKNGAVPWSEGYEEYKYDYIKKTIQSPKALKAFVKRKLSDGFGMGIDERSVEYPWIYSKLSKSSGKLLDAGSTFNFDFIVEDPTVRNKSLTIFTFYPEPQNYNANNISYVYGDLRDMYFKDAAFDEVVSQSTIEHIDMDNSIYGYETKHSKGRRSYEYLKAVAEMVRVLKPGGKLLLTFPFGKYEYHGFFQQFDVRMLDRLIELLSMSGDITIDYFKYEATGWRYAQKDELATVVSYNPHTGKGKGSDGAAHCRSITCIEYIKKPL